jgi:hypothetical protein
VPLVLAVVSFAIAVFMTATGMYRHGTISSVVAATSILYLTLGMTWLPGYAISLVWFWYVTRHDKPLFPSIYWVPVIQSLLIWFPSLLLVDVPFTQKLRMLPAWAFASLILGYVWIAIVRAIFYFWKRR